MPTHVNFYENLVEALARLKATVVTYDGEPFYVWTITDHKGDGKFRVYLSPVDKVQSIAIPALHQIPHGHSNMGPKMDEFLESHPDSNVIRKVMDSPAFNRFRPFPLGMCNQNTLAYYVARIPSRPKMEQGLQSGMLKTTPLKASLSADGFHRAEISLFTKGFRDCVVGDYPSPKEVLSRLTSGEVKNESAAFNREFALVAGPIDTIFLAYREDVIGSLSNGDFSKVKLGRKFTYCKEVVDELNLFYTIET